MNDGFGSALPDDGWVALFVVSGHNSDHGRLLKLLVAIGGKYVSCSGGQAVSAADQGQCCGGGLLGGGRGRVGTGAERAVEHQHGVTVCRGDDGGREPRGRWLAAAGQFGRWGQEGGADGPRGGGDLGAVVL